MKLVLAAALALLAGCTAVPGCYVGVSIFPPGPFVHCGLDVGKPAPKEDEELDLHV